MTLYDLLTPGGVNPAWWACPVQEGIPTLLGMAKTLLVLVAGVAFFAGILISVYYYLTAYGDEAKAKKGQDALKWTFIGGLVVIFSAVVITWAASLFLDESEQSSLNILGKSGVQLQATNNGGDTEQLGKGTNCQPASSDTTTDEQAPAEPKIKVNPVNDNFDDEREIHRGDASI